MTAINANLGFVVLTVAFFATGKQPCYADVAPPTVLDNVLSQLDATSPPTADQAVFIQAGTFRERQNVIRDSALLKKLNFPVHTLQKHPNGKLVYVLIIGPFSMGRNLDGMLLSIKAAGFVDAYFVTPPTPQPEQPVAATAAPTKSHP